MSGWEFGGWPPPPPSEGGGVSFAAVKAALAVADSAVGFNNQPITGVSTFDGLRLLGFGSNVGLGVGALQAATVMTNTVAIGDGALSHQTTSDFNVAIGSGAMRNATTSRFNTCVGGVAGENLTTSGAGELNTLIGVSAGRGLVGGTGNVAVGADALKVATGGNGNTCVGNESGNHLTTGLGNTLLGNFAGVGLLTGDSNVIIGNSTGSAVLTSTNIIIGTAATTPNAALASQLSIGDALWGDLGAKRLRVGGTGSLATQTSVLRVVNAAADTVPVLELSTTGANAATPRLFAGTQNPNAVVSANAGDLYLRKSGITSGIFVNQSAADPGTTWVQLL